MRTELKRLDPSQPTFEANGHTYRIHAGFSITRYCEYQILEKELGYGFTFGQMHESLTQMYALFNKGNFADAMIKCHNLVSGMESIDQREPVALKLCALFINREDEDITTINPDLMAEKIEDWAKEGYDYRDFFLLAIRTMDGFISAYNDFIQRTSQMEGLMPSA